jgi:hypothetical protein
MYPSAELKQLERRKALLRLNIAASRLQCAADAAVLARPIGLLDKVATQWRKISPFAKVAAVPLGLLLKRRLAPGKGKGVVGQALKWMPAVLSAARMFSGAAQR